MLSRLIDFMKTINVPISEYFLGAIKNLNTIYMEPI